MTQPAITVSAADANRHFSKLLRQASAGQSVTITSHGRPVATLAPIEQDSQARLAARAKALEALKAHWATLTPMPDVTWTREELYGDD